MWDRYFRTARARVYIYGIDSIRLPRSQNGPRASSNAKSGLASLGEAEALPRPARPVTLRVRACFQLRPDRPSPQSQSFPEALYGSGLPTSLTYIVLLTRGCSPWRPAVVMGTTSGESLHSSPGFSRVSQRNTGHCSRLSALRGSGAYLRSSRFPANPPLTKKRHFFPGLRPASPGSIASQLWPSRGGEFRLQVRKYWPDSLSTRGCTPARGRPAPPLRAELP